MIMLYRNEILENKACLLNKSTEKKTLHKTGFVVQMTFEIIGKDIKNINERSINKLFSAQSAFKKI